MRKWIAFLCPLIMVFILTSFGVQPRTTLVQVPKHLQVEEDTPVMFPTLSETQWLAYQYSPFLGFSYTGFKEALGYKESQGNYFTTNSLGYLGKYQFGLGTLQLVGVYSSYKFLNDPELQEEVFRMNLARNKWILRKDIARFQGKKIRGVLVTESGILAAAHLAGPGNVKRYLRSAGTHNVRDAYGSSIAYYLKKFKGYDTSEIEAQKNPRIPKNS